MGDVDIFTQTYRPLIKEGRKVRVPYLDNTKSEEEFAVYEEECIQELKNS